ncbi:MAG: transglycosylase SLT domain-containing protein [Spirochaetota bacterium]
MKLNLIPTKGNIVLIVCGGALISMLLIISDCFSLPFFTLFKNPCFSASALAAAEQFDPDSDALYIPSLHGKDFFHSVDDMSIIRRRDVRRYLYNYLTSHRQYIIQSISRAEKYRPIVASVFDRYPDMPKDLLLLPLLESGYDPYAVSPSQATGLWQFVSNTSAPLGLKNDSYVDERRNIEKSTEAALRHLRTLYRKFGSWEAALAAYNGGAGYVSRTQAHSPNTEFWALVDSKAFRPETNEYVSRYAALMLIYKNQRRFGISSSIDTDPAESIETVVFKTPVNIGHLSAATGVPEKTLREFNPELKGNMTPPYYTSYRLRVTPEIKEAVLQYAKDPSWQF